MDFDLTFSEKENQNSLTEQDLKKEVNIENTSLESDLEQAGLDVEFELKSESDKNFISQKNIDESGFNSELKNNSNPFEQSIDQTISSQSESRKAHLKAYNHQFSHQYQKVEEFEKEPAYKRKGLDLNDNLPEAQSRLSIENDGNNEPQIRSNNSFLHDNVD
jgi:cell division protein FtsZ